MGYNYLIVGAELNCVPDLNVALDTARNQNFDYIISPLVHPRYERELIGESKRYEPFTRYFFIILYLITDRTCF